jgi:condensin complex subunit 1
VLSLQHFMCVNREFTVEHLPLVFGLLEARHIPNQIKNNILISLGDNYYRYPNDMEAYLPRMMNCLNDKEIQIKRTALMIVTHLILMDLLKTKADISKIAKMLNDPDPQIQ